MKQKKQCKRNIKYRFVKITVSSFFAIYLLLSVSNSVSAAPAELLSSSSVVYEKTDSNSTPKGNLVKGNTFELNDSITAENGEKWYLITTTNGTKGYIKGEITTDIDPKDSVQEDSPPITQGTMEATPKETAPKETAPKETVVPEETETTEETTESSSMTEELEISSNMQEKTYLLQENTNRLKEPAGQTDLVKEETEEHFLQNIWNRIDKPFVILICIALFSVIIIYACYTKLTCILSISRKSNENLEKLWNKSQRTKKRKKVKRSKKKRTTKEAKKWKSNLQK